MRYSRDKKINEMVKELLKAGWRIKSTKRHTKLHRDGNPNVITVPCSPSDGHSYQNWLHQVRAYGAQI